MADPQEVLAARVGAAIAAAFGAGYAGSDPLIRPSAFADFQSNAALPLAKRLRRPARDVAAEISAHLDVTGVAEAADVSGPGFINLTLTSDWIAAQAGAQLADPRLGVGPADPPQVVVVEYSSPNIAKEMHVGHLRTTIVGDALARILEFAGHRVIRDNHVGDWGTQFGMLIEHLLDVGEDSAEAGLLGTDPNLFYQAARRKFDSDPRFAERSRLRVVKLQGGDAGTLRLWQQMMDLSRDYLHRIYGQLGVTLTDADIRGESFYNSMLADVCDELEASGVAVINDGALCAFPPGFTGRDGEPLPVIIRKSDGGYNYSTSDLATVRYRVRDLHADRAIYVVGSAQALHFRMVFAVAEQAGWLPSGARFEHAQIGNVLGTDGKMLRTRAGDTIKLSELLRESVERAAKVFDELGTSSQLDARERAEIAEAVGIGAVKYADLSTALDSEYVFDWDRMISFKGNTGPYLQYATTRIRSIFRKAGLDPDEAVAGYVGSRGLDPHGAAAGSQASPGLDPHEVPGSPVLRLTEDAERALALTLLRFGQVLHQAGETSRPHVLASFLFDAASAFTTFYEQCPVLKAADESVRASRLALSALTLRVLTTGLGLLGVAVPERM
jgi:arginyl-tRNA synthetase